MPFREQKRDGIAAELERGWPAYLVRLGCSLGWTPDGQGGLAFRAGDELGHGRPAIEHGKRLPPPHGTQVLAQVALEVGHPNGLHDHKMAMSGHIVKCSTLCASVANRYSLTRRSRKALPITDTEDRLMAALAIMGDSTRPKTG